MEAELGRTRRDLEWNRIEEAVLGRCRGAGTRRRGLPVATTREGTEVALLETAELLRAERSGDRLPIEVVPDVGPAVDRAERKGVLDGPTLRDIGLLLGAARTLRRHVASRRATLPRIAAVLALDPTLDALESQIGAAIDADGTLFDHASPELARLRAEIANVRARLVARLEELLVKQADLLQDRFYTEREGRYVLPVRRDAHERVYGIVHGTSASGATVFVEPQQLVEAGNRLKIAQAEMEREEARLFAALSDAVRTYAAELSAAVDTFEHVDLRAASARFGADLGAHVPTLAEGAVVRMARARHPVLALDGVDVVANDLSLAAGNVLVLSGPNAGGKTVALKTLGLAALMTRAGLPFPAEDGGACGFFDAVMSDVGDDQSLEKSLSTFSAHVVNVARMLQEAGPRSLVLLDELAGGTDPGEGAALACAIATALADQGAAVAVTTHYDSLKALAARDPRFRNAAVGFDAARMAPTFSLHDGMPGASSAFLVAARYGIPPAVLERARANVQREASDFEALVRSVEAMRADVERERALLGAARASAERDQERVKGELEALRAKDYAKVEREAERLLAEVRRAKAELRAARRAMREAASDAALEETRKKLEVVERAARATASAVDDARPKADAVASSAWTLDALTPGTKVHVPHLGKTGDVVEPPQRGRVRVAIGPMKLWVDVTDVRRPAEPAAAPDASEARPEARRRSPSVGSVDTTLDVRGLRVDEALAMADAFLDRVYGANLEQATIVHGVGSGALRDALRDHLRRATRYVSAVRPGEADEGGDRITVVAMR